MSLVDVFKRFPDHPVFEGEESSRVMQLARLLEETYQPYVQMRMVNCTVNDEDVGICTYVWNPPEEKKTGKTVLILNGIFTTGRCNDLSAYSLSQEYGHRVVCFDYPGKGKRSHMFAGKEDYTPLSYTEVLRDLVDTFAVDGNDITLFGYSHGGRVIYDYYQNHSPNPAVKAAVIADMGPERPVDAAKRRARRNQHKPVYRTVGEAFTRMKNFFSGHGQSLPDAFVINVINRDFALYDDGEQYGVRFHYDSRSMMGYCDELNTNPRMLSWKGFDKMQIPTLF